MVLYFGNSLSRLLYQSHAKHAHYVIRGPKVHPSLLLPTSVAWRRVGAYHPRYALFLGDNDAVRRVSNALNILRQSCEPSPSHHRCYCERLSISGPEASMPLSYQGDS